jgi:hypothetical protein
VGHETRDTRAPSGVTADQVMQYDQPVMISHTNTEEYAADGYMTRARIDWIIDFARRTQGN